MRVRTYVLDVAERPVDHGIPEAVRHLDRCRIWQLYRLACWCGCVGVEEKPLCWTLRAFKRIVYCRECGDGSLAPWVDLIQWLGDGSSLAAHSTRHGCAATGLCSGMAYPTTHAQTSGTINRYFLYTHSLTLDVSHPSFTPFTYPSTRVQVKSSSSSSKQDTG